MSVMSCVQVAVMAAAVSPLVWFGLPVIGGYVESKMFPILGWQAVSDATREGGRVCWTWRFDKLRDARPYDVDFWLETESLGRVFVSVFNEVTGEPLSSKATSPAGANQRRRLCAASPRLLPAGEPVRVRAVWAYAGSHPFWTVPQDVATPNIE